MILISSMYRRTVLLLRNWQPGRRGTNCRMPLEAFGLRILTVFWRGWEDLCSLHFSEEDRAYEKACTGFRDRPLIYVSGILYDSILGMLYSNSSSLPKFIASFRRTS